MGKQRTLSGTRYAWLISIAVALGGFLFGFDTAVISGAINMIKEQFQLTPVMEGWVMSSALVGCIAGAGIAGWLADRFGRKKVLFISAILFIVSALLCAIAQTTQVLIYGRLTGGIGVGFAAMVSPMYIAEVSMPQLRGRMVSLYQLAITAGILVSYLSNSFIVAYKGQSEGILHFFIATEPWRGMLGSNIIPAIIFLIFLFLVPESPRWLIKEKRDKQGYNILAKIGGHEAADRSLREIKYSLRGETGNFQMLLKPSVRKTIIIGLLLPLFQQMTGITVVMYYAPAIFESAGIHREAAMNSAVIIGLINMIFTLVSIWKIDKWGRKALLFTGFAGLSLALMLIGSAFYITQISPIYVALFVILYIAVFAATVGPGVWVVIAEIFPTKIRGRAMSVATLALFTGSAVITQVYPWLRENIGIANTFFLFGIAMIPAAWFVHSFMHETKGKSLEEIEHDISAGELTGTKIKII